MHARHDLLGISCLAGLGEEMFFRGWVQDLFAQAMPLNWAIVAAALLFGLMHAITLTYALLAASLASILAGSMSPPTTCCRPLSRMRCTISSFCSSSCEATERPACGYLPRQ